MSSPATVDFTTARQRVENLDAERVGNAIDTLAGAVLYLFVKLNDVDAALARLSRRISALEGLQSRTSRKTPSAPVRAGERGDPAKIGLDPLGGVRALPKVRRARGRPRKPGVPRIKRPPGRPRKQAAESQPATS
jgi:hypothetical protein